MLASAIAIALSLLLRWPFMHELAGGFMSKEKTAFNYHYVRHNKTGC